MVRLERTAIQPLEISCVHCNRMGVAGCDEVVYAMIAQMALFRPHGVIITRISLGASDDPGDPSSDRAGAMDEPLEDACARFRFPRPAHLVMMY